MVGSPVSSCLNALAALLALCHGGAALAGDWDSVCLLQGAVTSQRGRAPCDEELKKARDLVSKAKEDIADMTSQIQQLHDQEEQPSAGDDKDLEPELKAAKETLAEKDFQRLQLKQNLSRVQEHPGAGGTKQVDKSVAEFEGKASRLMSNSANMVDRELRRLRDELDLPSFRDVDEADPAEAGEGQVSSIPPAFEALWGNAFGGAGALMAPYHKPPAGQPPKQGSAQQPPKHAQASKPLRFAEQMLEAPPPTHKGAARTLPPGWAMAD